MPMDSLTELMTAEDLWKLSGNGQRYELVKGELRTMPPSGGEHGYVTLEITYPAMTHIKRNDLGVYGGAETGYLIARDPDTVRGADFSFVRKERIPPTGIPKTYWPFAPDLATEVVSPGDTLVEVEDK